MLVDMKNRILIGKHWTFTLEGQRTYYKTEYYWRKFGRKGVELKYTPWQIQRMKELQG